MPERPSNYSREEMDAILKRAIERQQAKSDGVEHEDLVAAAAEVGISREDVEAAAREVRPDAPSRERTREPAPEDEERRRAMKRAERGFALWLVVSVGCFALARATDANWWIWVAGPWGIAIAMQWVRLMFPAAPRPSRRERRRRRREEKLRDFERRVEVGADALLRVVGELRSARSNREDVRARVAAADDLDRPRVDPRDPDEITKDDTPNTKANRRASNRP